MTENEMMNGWTFEETIKTAENLMEEENNAFKWDVLRHLRDFAEHYKEQLEQYRAIGTVEELQEIGSVNEIKMVLKKREAIIMQLTDCIKEYQKIGTIEEFKALKEKSVAKKPIYSDFDENEAGEIIPYKAVCPVCGHEFEFGTWNDEENHHCVCEQKLDWSE